MKQTVMFPECEEKPETIPASASGHIRPTGDKVLVRRLEPSTTTPGGIILPDTARAKPGRGVVMAIGPKVTKVKGQTGIFDTDVPAVRPGQEVYFSSYAGFLVEVPGSREEFLLMREEEIYATIE